MIEQSEFVPKQMNGPVINAFEAGVNNELTDAIAVQNYLYKLSIATAQETELENIGCLIGYPRPLVPDGFGNENMFLFGSEPITNDPLIGFGSDNSNLGGEFSTTDRTEGQKMSLGLYRQLLDKVAIIKRYGVTLDAIDQIARTIDPDYTLSYNENNDIVITYADQIGYKNIWILTQLFYKIATQPQIVIIAGGN